MCFVSGKIENVNDDNNSDDDNVKLGGEGGWDHTWESNRRPEIVERRRKGQKKAVAEGGKTMKELLENVLDKHITHINILKGRYTKKVFEGYNELIKALPLTIESIDTKGKFTYMTFVSDNNSVSDNKKFYLIGHSFGGYISLCYAIKYPDYIIKLFLLSPVGITDIKNNTKEDKKEEGD